MYSYRVVAVDLRGYNLSERPEGLENYKLPELVEDLRALIEHFSKYNSIGDVKKHANEHDMCVHVRFFTIPHCC